MPARPSLADVLGLRPTDDGQVFDAPPDVTYYCVSRQRDRWVTTQLMSY